MNIDIIANQLEHSGYIVLDNALPGSLLTKLVDRCHNTDTERFQAAQIGRGIDKKQINSIRGDVISWLEDSNTTDQLYLAWMEQLRTGLNAALYLGLFDYESHYAIYDAGAGYAKHSDVLAGKKNRILSTVLYLNEDWQSLDGGELVLFDPEGIAVIASINPTFGRMIIFLSDTFPHEVLRSHQTRRSIAGWFRVSGSQI